LNSIVLADGEAAALFHNFVQVADLTLKVLNQFTSLSFLVLCSLDKLPSLVNLAFEDGNSVAVFLGKLDGSFDLGCILDYRVL
jgi:hypothetical protein